MAVFGFYVLAIGIYLPFYIRYQVYGMRHAGKRIFSTRSKELVANSIRCWEKWLQLIILFWV